jgi:hypothetical protein
MLIVCRLSDLTKRMNYEENSNISFIINFFFSL